MTEVYCNKHYSMEDKNLTLHHNLSNGGKIKVVVNCCVNGVFATEEEIRTVLDRAKDAAIEAIRQGK